MLLSDDLLDNLDFLVGQAVEVVVDFVSRASAFAIFVQTVAAFGQRVCLD